MIKNRRTSGLLSMALATCLVVSAVPVQTVDSILGNAAGRVTAYAEETAQSTKPLTTLWKTQEVGPGDLLQSGYSLSSHPKSSNNHDLPVFLASGL